MGEHKDILLESLKGCGWQELITSALTHECRRYAEIFLSSAKTEQDPGRANALRLLGHVSTMVLRTGEQNADQPLAPQAVMNGWRSSVISDFSQDELDALRELTPEITDAELRSRVSDLIWISSRHFASAKIAIPAYIESAKTLIEEQQWKPAINRLDRSIRLATKLRQRDGTSYKEAIEYVCQLLGGSDLRFGARKDLMMLLLEFSEGDPAIYVAMTDQRAKHAERDGDWVLAREYWWLNALWQDRIGGEFQTRPSRILAAMALESAADSVLSKPTPAYGTAAAYLDDAVQELRRLGEMAEVARLHARLLQVQALMTSELVYFEGEPLNVGDQIEAARQAVIGKGIAECLMELSAMLPTITEADALSAAEDISQEAPLLQSIMSSKINGYGRTVARRPFSYSDSPGEVENARYADAVEYAAKYLGMAYMVTVESARQQILLEHIVEIDDFTLSLEGNPFIDLGRTMLVARGLHAGLIGDFPLAIHLLIPQVEHSLRKVLNQAGVITSGLDDPTGIQDEHNINSLLYREELQSVFGDNLIFSMKVSLVERWGFNMRNRMAHGLLDESSCYTESARYVWGLALYLYLLPSLIQQQKSSGV